MSKDGIEVCFYIAVLNKGNENWDSLGDTTVTALKIN
jgi:hypothetical protein